MNSIPNNQEWEEQQKQLLNLIEPLGHEEVQAVILLMQAVFQSSYQKALDDVRQGIEEHFRGLIFIRTPQATKRKLLDLLTQLEEKARNEDSI